MKQYDCMQDEARKLLAQYEERLRKLMPSASIETEIVFGRPKELILHSAEKWPADLIVMGSHGRRDFSRFLLGSVSSAVLSHSPCSVVIVKLPQPERQHTPDENIRAAAVI